MLRPADCAQVQLNNARVQLLKQAMVNGKWAGILT